MRDENSTPAALDGLLGDFDPSEAANKAAKTEHVTFWIPVEYKARYDRLQERTGRRFSKKIKELIQAAIDVAEKRAG